MVISPQQAFSPYWPLSFTQFPRTTWPRPAIIAAPRLSTSVLFSITQPAAGVVIHDPFVHGRVETRIVRFCSVTLLALPVNA